MNKIFWDTNLFIYLIEQTFELYDKVLLLRHKMIQNNDLLVTSTLTLGELLVKPIEENKFDLAEEYRKLITSGAILIPFDERVAEKYAKIRAIYKTVKPPDAIQLACAAVFGINEFYTNDERLSSLKIDGINKIKSVQDL